MLIRHDPFQRLDRLSDSLWRRLAAESSSALQVHRDADGVEITLDLPGVQPDDIEVSVERNLLTIRASRVGRGRAAAGGEASRSEVMTREVMIGDSLDSDRASASFEHGVLTIEIPARGDRSPRKLDITTSSAGPTPVPTTSASSATADAAGHDRADVATPTAPASGTESTSPTTEGSAKKQSAAAKPAAKKAAPAKRAAAKKRVAKDAATER